MYRRRRLHAVVLFMALTVAVGITLFLTIRVWRSSAGDVVEYQQYAQAFWWWKPAFQV